MRSSLALLASLALFGCSRSPETVVHFAAPAGGAWEVREATGAHMCTVPCIVGLEEHQSVVVARDDGTIFVVQQDNLGPGAWSGAVRVREEPKPGALAVSAFSGALVAAGAHLLRAQRDDSLAAGIFLSGLGTAGLLAASSWRGTPREELWLQRTAKAD